MDFMLGGVKVWAAAPGWPVTDWRPSGVYSGPGELLGT
jgi:hypothetical protein